MKIIKCKSYNELYKKSWENIVDEKKNKGCRECGNLAVGHNGLCQKCQEEEERSKERYRDGN